MGASLGLTACSPSGTPNDAWGSTISDDLAHYAKIAPMTSAQEAALSDGRVSETEVHESFDRYQSCLRAEGYELHNVVQDGPFINFGVPDEAVQTGVDDRCYSAEYAGVDLIWQVVESSDYSERAARVGLCLDLNGITVDSATGAPATVAEMENALVQAGITLDECSSTVHPDAER